MQITERHDGAIVEVMENGYTVFCAEFDCNGIVFCETSSEENGIEKEWSKSIDSKKWFSMSKEEKIKFCNQ